MFEIQFYGRGGQGLYLASQILAYAAFLDGKFPQVFPEFTAERRGAPISAFLRIDSEPIRLRCRIYRPNVVLVFDPAFLPHISDVLRHTKPTGSLLVNGKDRVEVERRIRLAYVDADGIAKEFGLTSEEGYHMGNMAMLGAFCRFTGIVTFESLLFAIREKMPRLGEENCEVARAGFSQIVVQGMTSPRSSKLSVRKQKTPFNPISISCEISKGRPTNSWRMADPTFTEKCTACGICALFCPEGVISVLDGRLMAVDLDYCKGCWICVNVCPVEGALAIREKKEAPDDS